MIKYKKIVERIASKKILKIRQLLQKKVNVFIKYIYDDSFQLQFFGPVTLTSDGIAKWSMNGILDLKVILIGAQVIIQDKLNENELNDICSLFNTIAGNVNEDTYNKYIQK